MSQLAHTRITQLKKSKENKSKTKCFYVLNDSLYKMYLSNCVCYQINTPLIYVPSLSVHVSLFQNTI